MSKFNLPLSSVGAGEIEDANGKNVVDVWRRMPDGRFAPDGLTDEQHADLDALTEAKAAELVLRVNLHSELVAVVLRSTDVCQYDILNPCWNGRPTDVLGLHWAGHPACRGCHASALIHLLAEHERAADQKALTNLAADAALTAVENN